MADAFYFYDTDLSFSFSGDEHSVHQGVTKLQALYRGWRVRKDLEEIKQLYQSIVLDIDGDAMEVSWSRVHYASLPVIQRRKQLSKESFDKDKLKLKSQTPSSINTKSYTTSSSKNSQKGCSQTEDDILCPEISHNLPAFPEGVPISRPKRSESVQVNTETQSFDVPEVETSDQSLPRSISIAIQAELSEQNVSVPETKNDDSAEKPHSCKDTDFLTDVMVSEIQKLETRDGETQSSQSYRSDFEETPSRDDTLSKTSSQDGEKTESPIESLQSDGDKSKPQVRAADLPQDKVQLEEMKKKAMMELLWVQQAIHSRKHYLRLKQELS